MTYRFVASKPGTVLYESGTNPARQVRMGLFGALVASTLPAETCTYDGVTNIRTCELWAVAGTLALPGTSIPIWGYADTDPALWWTNRVRPLALCR